MLEQQQLVADPAVGPLGDEPLLEGPGLAIVDPAQPRRDDRPRLGGRPAPLGGQRLDRHGRTITGRTGGPVRASRWRSPGAPGRPAQDGASSA